MPRLSRRDLLKSTLAASLGGAALAAVPARSSARRKRPSRSRWASASKCGMIASGCIRAWAI